MKKSATCLVLLSVALFCIKIQKFSAEATTQFGPYSVVTRSIDKCQLGVPVDTDRMVTNTLKVVKVSRTNEELQGQVIIPLDIPKIRGTLSVDFWRDGGYKPFISKKFNNACDEEFIGPILKQYLSIEKNCLIKKGNYLLESVDPNKIVKAMIGEKFFYEKISVTVAFYSKTGLVFCIKVALESKPPPKATRSPAKTN